MRHEEKPQPIVLSEEDKKQLMEAERKHIADTMLACSFEEGDTVEAFGHQGVIVKDPSGPASKYVVASFGISRLEWFYKDGKLNSWHKEPSLKLIEKKQKTVTRYKVLFKEDIASIKDGQVTERWVTKDLLDAICANDRSLYSNWIVGNVLEKKDFPV